MADQKISQLNAYTVAATTDLLPIVDVVNGLTKNITLQNHINTWVKDKYFTNRPALYYGKYSGAGSPKPTPVERGAVIGFSMPIYNNDDEELFFRDHIPGRWDEASDIVCTAKCYIDTANTAGEKFQFQLSWSNSAMSGVVVSNTTTDVKKETTIVSGTQYAAYLVDFTIDWDIVNPDIAGGDLLACRLRRIAVEAGGDECEGEIVVVDITLKYKVNKIFKDS